MVRIEVFKTSLIWTLLWNNSIYSESSADIYMKSILCLLPKPGPLNLSHPCTISDQNFITISRVYRHSHVAWSDPYINIC
jgi:hypothetical protein